MIDHVFVLISKILIRKHEIIFFVGLAFAAIAFAHRKRWVASVFLLAAAFFGAILLSTASIIFGALGADSFAEARNFDLQEASFWIQTTRPMFVWKTQELLKFSAFYLLLAAALYFIVNWTLSRTKITQARSDQIKRWGALPVAIFAIFGTFSETLAFFLKNSDSFEETQSNFSGNDPTVALDTRNLNLVIYIGETAAAMNFEIYGYPRNTNPRLAQRLATDPGLLVFENVFSTHTHTSPSLLEALSLAVRPDEDFLPIDKRRRISVADVLVRGGVDARLFSNQGRTGVWSQASTIVFKNVERHFSTGSEFSQNKGLSLRKPYDGDFFRASLDRENLEAPRPLAIFLHSYAGHGPYREYVPPEFHDRVDSFFCWQVRHRCRQKQIRVDRIHRGVRLGDPLRGSHPGHDHGSHGPTRQAHGAGLFLGPWRIRVHGSGPRLLPVSS